MTGVTFVKDYDDDEQMRPFMPGYLAVRADIEANGRYPYNEYFKGRIEGIEGPTEDYAIYKLQQTYARDLLAEKVDAFMASGGRRIDALEAGVTLRGTVVGYGFYLSGTGWSQWDDARLRVDERGRPIVTPKGKRNGLHVQGTVLFREATR